MWVEKCEYIHLRKRKNETIMTMYDHKQIGAYIVLPHAKMKTLAFLNYGPFFLVMDFEKFVALNVFGVPDGWLWWLWFVVCGLV